MQREVLGALLGNLKPRELLVFERLYRLMLERAAGATEAEAEAEAQSSVRPGGSTLTLSPGF
jgi:hypothetical protein